MILFMSAWIEPMLRIHDGCLRLLMLLLLTSRYSFLSPIVLVMAPHLLKTKTSYKIEAWCFLYEEVVSIITASWGGIVWGSNMFVICQKLGITKSTLFNWCRAFKKNNCISWHDLIRQAEDSQLLISATSMATTTIQPSFLTFLLGRKFILVCRIKYLIGNSKPRGTGKL